VVPVPGVSAVITALSGSGLPTDAFVFIGFLPKKEGKRFRQLEALSKEPRTVIFYESPKRVSALLGEIISVFGDRYSVLSREMTKPHEEFIRGKLSEILYSLNERSIIRGECTLLVSGKEPTDAGSPAALKDDLQRLLDTEGRALSEIVKVVSKKYGLPKNRVYKAALQLSAKRN
jgi:16S rRNA (cytidine1402-2'-O)-methyltransferase